MDSREKPAIQAFIGTAVHCLSPERMQIMEDCVIGFDQANGGQIKFLTHVDDLEELSTQYTLTVHDLSDSQFLMPGLVDAHLHAPQYKYTGAGYHLDIQDITHQYKIPNEAKFSSVETAKKIYTPLVQRTLRNGTTTASYIATIHVESTKELCRIIGERGQRAHVGKPSLDYSWDSERMPFEQFVDDTRQFVRFVKDMKNPLIQPVVNPRFASAAPMPLLTALGILATEEDVPIHSHICQQKGDTVNALALFTNFRCFAGIFNGAGMLNSKTYLAHGVHMEHQDIDLLYDKKVGIVHCPNSNFSLQSGCLDVRNLLQMDFKVGLGTDVAGGYSPSILDAMRRALDVSKAVSFTKNSEDYIPLSLHEVIYMATVGGAQVLGLEHKIGNFKVGKEFDALVVDVAAPHGNPVFDVFPGEGVEDKISKFFYLGDDRNIVKRFVAGQVVEV